MGRSGMKLRALEGFQPSVRIHLLPLALLVFAELAEVDAEDASNHAQVEWHGDDGVPTMDDLLSSMTGWSDKTGTVSPKTGLLGASKGSTAGVNEQLQLQKAKLEKAKKKVGA